MANGTTTLSEARELETANALKWIGVGVGIIAFAALMFYIEGVILRDNLALLKFMRVVMGLLALAGGAVIAGAFYRMSQIKKIVTVPFTCPYCDGTNQLLGEPTSNFDCEICHQTVRFENGVMVPVRVVSCGSCGTDNRVSSKATRLICSKCNATIQIQAVQPAYASTNVTPTAAPVQPARLLTTHNFDVLVQSYDHAREGHLVSTLQQILDTDPVQTKRLIGTITDRTPLIVGAGMPQAEAEALRAQLSQLGAHVMLRPS